MCAPTNYTQNYTQLAPLSLFGHPLSKVASHSYLRVKLDSKLSRAIHVAEITTKSSKVLAMVKRILGPCIPEADLT